ncbi:MAG: hypothetical protein Lokiarch_21320 [Candidatus Lokiarchaeum sp. GC14_75]|nr:MAG: hypothetical protein Lokiarch_21320 [Candidatus Lokiarchaeum sp. GC14_75]
MPHKLINPILYLKSKEIVELDDISEEYIIFLETDKDRSKNSFVIWVIGGRGWGKTSLTFNEINIILKDNPKRFVQFLKAPPQLIENIKEVCPEELEDRFESIFKTRDIKKNAILVIDEGLLGLNAKEALKKEMRNLGKFLSKSRHPNVIVLINSVNLNILSEFRDMIDIVIYKHCASTFIKNNRGRDPFLEEYMEIITGLREWESIVVSNYKWFEKFGMISLKYEDWCSWFNDKISRYQKETSSDVVFDESNRIINNNKKVALKIINEIGYLYHKRGGFDSFCTWLSDVHPDIYYDNQTQLKKIFNFYKYFLDENEQNEIYAGEEIVPIKYIEKESFPDFVRRIIPDDKTSRVAEGLALGDSYDTIRDNNKDFKTNFTRDTGKMLRNEGNLQEGLGYLFEKWYAYILGVPEDNIEEIVGGANKNKPDLIWEGKIYSIKLRVDIKNKRLKFSQSNDLSPEYLEAKKRGQNYFLIFMNTKWSQKLIIKEIDPFNDPDEIIVSKPQKIKRLIM